MNNQHTSPKDVELVEEAGGAPVEGYRRSAVVPGRSTDTRLIKTGLPRSVLLRVLPSVRGVSARGWRRLVRLCVSWTSGSGVGVSVWFALLRRAEVGLELRVDPLQSAVTVVVVIVVVVVGGGGGSGCCSSSQRGFGKKSDNLSGFLAVVLQQAVTLQGLFALVVKVVVSRDGGQVTVLRPDGGRQGMESELGLAGLGVLLQGLVDGEGGLFDQHPALVALS